MTHRQYGAREYLAAIIATSVFFSALALGCGGGGGGSAGTGTTSGGTSTTFVLPAAGGTVSTESGNVVVTAPSNAVAANTTVTVTPVTNLSDPVLIPNTAYEFSSVSLQAPVTLTLKYSHASIPSGISETGLGIYYQSGGTWSELGNCTVDPVNSVVTGTVPSASFALKSRGTGTVFAVRGLGSSANVTAEAELDGSGNPTVRVTWAAGTFVQGNVERVQWQVFRNDVASSPVSVVTGTSTSLDDTLAGTNGFTWSNFNGVVGGSQCTDTSGNNSTALPTPGLVVGKPYRYQVQLVYATTLGGGSNTACYFGSSLVSSVGTVTPLASPQLQSGAGGSVPTFSWTSSVNASYPTSLEYVVQLSPSPAFPSSQTYTTSPIESSTTGLLSSAPINVRGSSVPGFISGATTLWWRVGVKNLTDMPGPIPDAFTQMRYIFSQPMSFTP